ncbi:hypothetical protein ABZX98_00275 [Streptomyces sp. NPDC002992]|uniref:hypothetical protein n=1 Tax=Streptomyces sp. NPDC002992 TaxID=3154273 RepID=UPI0033A94160
MTQPESAPVTEPASAPVPDAEPPRRRRTGRTVALIAVAAVLGIVGGTAVGYGIQAEREPTPLAALNQPDLAYPKPLPRGQNPAPLTAAEDRRIKTDGDLRKLLLPRPAGTKKSEFSDADGWMTLREYASGFRSPEWALEDQLENKLRRIAATSWQKGEFRTTEIRLVQYRAGDSLGARDHAEGQIEATAEMAENDGEPIKGSADGRVFVLPVHKEAGYVDLYEARAYFHRGDIMVTVYIIDTKKISVKEISSVAEQQLGRL